MCLFWYCDGGMINVFLLFNYLFFLFGCVLKILNFFDIVVMFKEIKVVMINLV